MTRYEVELTDEQARKYVRAWDNGRLRHFIPTAALESLADAIRANPPKPPRMAEPGWGESVFAAKAGTHYGRERWMRHRVLGDCRWSTEDGATAAWSELIDPQPWWAVE